MDGLLLAVIRDVLTPGNLIVMVIGILIGIMIGALPGFQANMGMALLIPITYGMSPDTGILMLVSLFAAAIYGGSITAILFHTPGTTASAVTAIEGHVMAREGKAGTAIRIATWCSSIGGLVGAFCLLLVSPPLSMISLQFGPPEYFLLAVFGLTTIASIASGSLLVKGLLAGTIGFLLSTVGMDLDSGFPRYTFGFHFLDSGVTFVPAVIGLFALSQVLTMAEEQVGTVNRPMIAFDKKDWRFFLSWQEFKTIWPSIPRSLAIGILIGVLPGAGADVASWVSYHEAKRFSKHPEKFGKGAIDGIASAEVAKNTECGGALIPLLTLGIPGSTSAAVLLGALMMHGLVPGRELFTKYAEITYTIIVGFILANFLMAVIGMMVSRYIARLASINVGVLIPVIVTLCVVGTFALGNNIYDVWVMVVFGIVGYFMKKHGYHPAALVLGLILGPMAEKGFRQSVVLAKTSVWEYMFTRPISLVLLILMVLTIVIPPFLAYRNRKKAEAQANAN